MIDERIKKNPKWYVQHFLKIRTKSGQIVPLRLKPAQNRLYEEIMKSRQEHKPVRIIILKARQLGFSTIIEGLFFQQSATKKNVRTLIVAHDDDSTTNLFRMNKRFYDNLPDELKPMQTASNAKEIIFNNPSRNPQDKALHPGLDSVIRCVSAGGAEVRGDTLTNVHASEVAFWRDAKTTFTALLQAVPDEPNTSVIIESTPNGYNEFKEMWDNAVNGVNGFTPLFFPWHEEPGYTKEVEPNTEWTSEELEMQKAYNLTDGQLAWRRWCIATNFNGDAEMFKQEYASNPEEAFLTSGRPYFDNGKVIRHMNILEPCLIRGRYVYGEDETHKPTDIQFVEDPNGEVFIYEKPITKDENGAKEIHPYVIGGDTSGDGSDRFTAYAIDNSTGYQVAQIVYDGGSELYYTQQVYCLQKDYNEALTGIEINFSTYPEKMLEQWGARRLFIREKVDDSRGMLDTYKLGWRTDMRTRPLILANLQTIIANNIELIKSEELLKECLTFIYNDNMRPEAAEGSHDDIVIAAAICMHIREQQSYTYLVDEEEPYVKLIDRIDPKKKYRRR